MTYRELILREIETYCEAKSLSARAFSIAAVGHHKFLSRLKAGVSTLQSIEKADAYMRQHPLPDRTPTEARQ